MIDDGNTSQKLCVTFAKLRVTYLQTVRVITGDHGVALTTKGLRPLVNHTEVLVLKDLPARPHIIGVGHLEVVGSIRWF